MAAGPVALVRSGVFSPFLQFLEGIGAPCETHLDHARLSPSLFARGDSLVSLRQMLACANHAARQEGIPHLGFVVGQQAGLACLADVMRIASPMPSLQAAIGRVAETIRLISSAERICLQTRGDKACLCHHLALDREAASRQGDEFTLTMLIDFVRLAAGPRWRPSAVWIPASALSFRASYERMLEVPVRLGSGDWRVVFDAELLARPVRYGLPCMSDGAGTVERLQASAPALDFTESLRQAIASLLPRGNPHLAVVAEAAGLTARSLQRRLNEVGSSYSRLLEEVRQQQARQWLEATDAKVVEVAFELGYTDAANFSRAFRRWHGVPPQHVRSRSLGRTNRTP